MTCVPAIKSFHQEIYKLPEFISEPPPHSTFPKLFFSTSNFLKVIHRYIRPSWIHPPSRRPFHPRTAFHHSETSTSSSSFPLRGLSRPKGPNSKTEDLCRYSCNTFFPHIHNVYAPISAGNYRHWQISRHVIPPTSANNHSRYNKLSTWRSCSYSSPRIPPPQQASLSGISS